MHDGASESRVGASLSNSFLFRQLCGGGESLELGRPVPLLTPLRSCKPSVIDQFCASLQVANEVVAEGQRG